MVSRHGAEVLEKGASSSTKGKQTFKGTGYRLGQSEEDTQGIFAFKNYTTTTFPLKNMQILLCTWVRCVVS